MLEKKGPRPFLRNCPGGPGFQWRCLNYGVYTKQPRKKDAMSIVLGIERFGTLEEFLEVQQERRILEERENERSEREKRGEMTIVSGTEGAERRGTCLTTSAAPRVAAVPSGNRNLEVPQALLVNPDQGLGDQARKQGTRQITLIDVYSSA